MDENNAPQISACDRAIACPAGTDTPQPDPSHGTEPAGDMRDVTVDELIELFGAMRSALHRWHDAVRRHRGGPTQDTSRGQGRVLALLSMQGEMRQRDMGYILNIRPQSLGEVLGKLERAGLVTRRTSEKDRRVLLVSITEKGRSCVQDCKPPFPDVSLTDEELAQFVHMLGRMVEAFDADAARLNSMPPGAGNEKA